MASPYEPPQRPASPYEQQGRRAGPYGPPRPAGGSGTASLVTLALLGSAWIIGLAAMPIAMLLVAASTLGEEPGFGDLWWIALIEVLILFVGPLVGTVVALVSRRVVAAGLFSGGFAISCVAIVALLGFL